MRKAELLQELRDRLTGLPQADLTERLAFYDEMIDDRMEEGLSEEEAVAQLGPVDEIVAQILEETPLTKLVREKVRPKRRLRAWEIVLLVLGSPIWLSLLIVAFAVGLVLYLVLWVVVIVIWAVDLSFACSAVACLAGSVFLIMKGSPSTAIICAGAALLLAGLAILLFFGALGISKGVVKLTKQIVRGLKSLLLGKERVKV